MKKEVSEGGRVEDGVIVGKKINKESGLRKILPPDINVKIDVGGKIETLKVDQTSYGVMASYFNNNLEGHKVKVLYKDGKPATFYVVPPDLPSNEKVGR